MTKQLHILLTLLLAMIFTSGGGKRGYLYCNQYKGRINVRNSPNRLFGYV